MSNHMTQQEINTAYALAHAAVIGDEGSVAVCDLCGKADEHSHEADEYGLDRCDECGDRAELDADLICQACRDCYVAPEIFGILLG